MLPKHVHVLDGQATSHQHAIEFGEVGERNLRVERLLEEGRAAAGNQVDDEIIRRESGNHLQRRPRACEAAGVGIRVAAHNIFESVEYAGGR